MAHHNKNVLYDVSKELVIKTGSSDTTALTIDDSQDATFVGDITTSGESRKIRIVNAGGQECVQLLSDGSGDGQLRLNNSAGTTKVLLYAESAANNYINNGGNFGIGTDSPAALLEIAGSGDAIRVESTNAGAAGAQLDLLHFTGSPADDDVHALINMGGYYTGTSSAYATQIKSIWTDVSARDAELQFWTNKAGTLTKALTLDTDQNATFAGQVEVPDLFVNCSANINSSSEKLSVSGMSLLSAGSDSAASLYVKNTSTTADTFQPYIYFADTGGNRAGFGVETTTAKLKINSQNDMLFTTGSSSLGGTLALTLDTSQNATFAGTVASGAATAFNISSTSGKLSFANDPTNYYIHHKDSTDGIVVSGYYGASLAHRGNVKLSVGSGGIEVTGTQTVGGNVTINTTGVTNNVVLTSADTSAASAPDLVLRRTAAVADEDTLGVVEFQGMNGMVPSSTDPLTYGAVYSRMIDKDNNQTSLSFAAHKGNGSGAYIHSFTAGAIGTNNSATGSIIINPDDVMDVSSYNLEVKGTSNITGTATFAGQIRTTADIGRDDHNRIMFSTDDSIIFRVADTHRFRMDSDNFSPYIDSSYDLGTSSLYFRHTYTDAITTTGDATFGGNTFVAGDGSVFGHTSALMTDSANTNYNIQMSDGIAFGGAAYTFCNIFGSDGNMTIAANAYPANTGSESTITFKNSTNSGGTFTPLLIRGKTSTFGGSITSTDSSSVELVTNGSFAGVSGDVTALAGWSAYGSVTSRNITSNQLVLVTAATNTGVLLTVTTVSGQVYHVTADTSGDTGVGGVHLEHSAEGALNHPTGGGVDFYFTANTTSTNIYFRAGNNAAGTINIDNVSVKEVVNYHIGDGRLNLTREASGNAGLKLVSTTGGDPIITFNSKAVNRSGVINFQDQGIQLGSIDYTHNGDTMNFYTGGTGSGHKELTLHETAGATFRTKGTFGGAVTATSLVTTGSTGTLRLSALTNVITMPSLQDNGTFLSITQTGSESWLFKCESIGGGTADFVTIGASGGGYVAISESGGIAVASSARVGFDGPGGHTWIEEVSDNNLTFKVGNTEILNMTDNHLYIPDSRNLIIGNSSDFRLYHNATDSHIDNYTGNLNIVNNADNADINFYCDDGANGVRIYFFLDGSIAADGGLCYTTFPDNSVACWGDSQDIKISHQAGHGYIDNGTGALKISSSQTDGNIVFATDDGNGGSFDYFSLDGGSTTYANGATTAAYTKWQDKSRIALGTGKDLQLYHDGSNSYIQNLIGWLNIPLTQNGMSIANADFTESIARFLLNGACELYYDGSKKLETVTGGVTVTGALTATEDVVAYSDRKLKKNIKTLDGSKVYDMRGVSFTRKDTEKDGSGIIAQELQKIAPELVIETDGTLGVAYGNITGYLIEAIKELKAEVEELKNHKCDGCTK